MYAGSLANLTLGKAGQLPQRLGVTRRHNLAVRLDRNGKCPGLRPPLAQGESGGHFATRAETGVERAIAVVAHHGKVIASFEVGVTTRDNLPVRLNDGG